MCDILWSLPIKEFGEERITESFVHMSIPNVPEVSYFYTFKAVCDFLERNRLVSIICVQWQKAGSVEPFYV